MFLEKSRPLHPNSKLISSFSASTEYLMDKDDFITGLWFLAIVICMAVSLGVAVALGIGAFKLVMGWFGMEVFVK